MTFHAPLPPSPEPDDTRTRLLEAAGVVFSEHGYEAATVKAITDLAGANIAAVNYHFGDKFELYVQVLKRGLPMLDDALLRALRTGPPEERLRNFIAGFLWRMLGEGRPSWIGRLVAREMVQPTPALPIVVDEAMRPMYRCLRESIAAILGRPQDDERVHFAALSVVGQCVYWVHGRLVRERVWPGFRLTDAAVERLVEHVAAFSLGGLHAIAQPDRQVRRAHRRDDAEGAARQP